MKLVFFNDFTLGVLADGKVHDITSAVKDVPHITPQDLIQGVIVNFSSLRKPIEDLVRRSTGVPAGQVRLRPPLPRPTHIVAIAVNYMEFGARKEPSPINAFIKSSEAVIGKEARNVSAADAYNYIFGYVNFIDASARGLGNGSFYWGKSWDTFAPMGPCLVTADEVRDPQSLAVKLWVNGALRQDFPTSDMGHKIPRCVEWCSGVTTLEPGDIISTGTNHQGLGAMQNGDLIEMEVQGLERLTVHVKDPLKREWPRGIDRATADRAAGRTSTGGFGAPAARR